ncbi:MAG: hypothetical protein JWN76_1858 [Chitinophagaceae bacterium]|nr:hypothetical protein [Chitinophagaceae bacterium]
MRNLSLYDQPITVEVLRELHSLKKDIKERRQKGN